LTEW
jgi:hypothetical protein